MIPLYEENNKNLMIQHRESKHVSPHLHKAVEFVYVTKGTLEIGMGAELFHMDKGDLAIVFPDIIHHYQVFSKETSTAYYLLSQISVNGLFANELIRYCPENPVIRSDRLHPDTVHALKCLAHEKIRNPIVDQSYIQMILARFIVEFQLTEKQNIGNGDLIYQTVSYIAGHFKEDISLDTIAKALGVSKFAVSRVFSGTFHRNFKQYLNEQRLEYARSLLECTNWSVIEICMDAGFESQRTFNRVFLEKYRATPREYRNEYRHILTNKE